MVHENTVGEHNPYKKIIDERLDKIFFGVPFQESDIEESRINPVRSAAGKVRRHAATISEGIRENGQRRIHLSVESKIGRDITIRFFNYYPHNSSLEAYSFSPALVSSVDEEGWPSREDYSSEEDFLEAWSEHSAEMIEFNRRKMADEKELGLHQSTGIDDWEEFTDALIHFRRPRKLPSEWLRSLISRASV